MRHLRRHADGFPKGGMRVNRLADVHRIRIHFNSKRNLTNHAARMRADHAAVQGNKPFLTLMPCALAWSSVRPTGTSAAMRLSAPAA